MSVIQQITNFSRRHDRGEHRMVTAAQGGDRRAFDMLVQTHEKLLRGFMTRRVGTEAVEDVLQETWMAAWTALPKFTGQSRFKAWLFGIAVHKAQDQHRARGRTPTEHLSEEAEAALAAPDVYAAIDLRDAVQAALVRLPAAQREVLEMYYYAELTLPEIAETLQRNQNTVKYQFYRAHALVADGLGPL